LEGLVFEKSVAALRRVLPAVRAQHADVLVLAAHQGWRQWGDDAANEINALARAFPEIDVILGGHTHVAVEGMELQGVAYIQPGAHGLWLAKVQMQVDTNRHCVVRRTAELIAVDSSIPQDPELTQQSAPALADTKNYLRQELGQTIRELSAQSPYPGQSSVQALLAAAIAEAVQSDVVFHGTLSSASLAAGRIRMRDLWRIVPYENTIGVAQLTLAELAEILEENSRYWRTRQFRGLSGLTYELVRVSDAGPAKYQVQNIRLLDGSVPPPGARLRVAFNSHDLASAGARFPRLREIAEQPAARLQETDVDTRRAVRAYIQKHSPLDISAVESARLVRRRGSPKP
ncbi:MAG: bifunctional metallophosphatase/5'-nucleotidase, partial [Lentisphaerae bacterium]|nr:bifunctional metallophosphatase/5'-nucleotidase [Lentisphaerota bacterium]